MKTKSAIIIPVFNRRDLTLACLRHLYSQEVNSEVVLVDDGSTDGTSEAVEKEFPDVIIVKGDGNLFWTGGIRKGMQKAYDLGAEVFVWLNDDTLIDGECINYLIKRVQNNPELMLAPFCYEIDKNIEEIITNGLRGRTPTKGKRGEDTEVEGLSGYCVTFSKKVVEDIGYPDAERFPHYQGDASYTHKAHQNGFRLLICGEVELLVEDRYNPRSLKTYISMLPKVTYKDIFQSKKSPYRLATKKNMLMLRYGNFRGYLIYIGVTLKWYCTYTFSK